MNPALSEKAVWKEFAGIGSPIHFYNANGFVLGVYTPFLEKLSQKYHLSALEMRASWPDIGLPPKAGDWQVYADDLIAYLETRHNEPVIGVGHSMGATSTILAADKRPDLFKALVLIEPAMVSIPMAWLIRILPRSAMNYTKLVKGTLSKPDCWPERRVYEAYIRKFKGYQRFGDAAFEAMAAHGVKKMGKREYQLSFPKVWEAYNYSTPPNVFANIGRIKIPCLAIRGAPSVFFSQSRWDTWQKTSPHTLFKENLKYGHLMPLESPCACFELVDSGLSEILKA